jgi:hypothetical protein
MTENPITTANPVGEALAVINNLTDSQLEELGQSLSHHTLARLSVKSLGQQMGGAMRKLVSLGVVAAFIALLAFIWVYFNSTKTIASGERNTRQADWGYAVDQYRFRNRMRLNLWSDSSLFSSSSHATLDLSNVSVNRISEERWLADSRAVYLNLLVAADGKEQSAKVIYDFQRGELYTSSPFDLWRVPTESDKNLKMSDAEFQAVLNRFSGQAPPAVPAASVAPSVAASPSASTSAEPSPSASASPSASPSPDKAGEPQK